MIEGKKNNCSEMIQSSRFSGYLWTNLNSQFSIGRFYAELNLNILFITKVYKYQCTFDFVVTTISIIIY